jgi:hypothetical protein
MIFDRNMTKQYQEQATEEVFDPLDRLVMEGLHALSPLSERQLNTIPFPGSWSAGQVTRHIIKSNGSIDQALGLPGNATERCPDQRVQELKEIFLDFSIKFEAAPFITPTRDSYQKERLIADLSATTLRLSQTSRHTDLDKAIHHPAFGEITKLELLFFVLFHTQRHVRQLKNIVAVL